MSLTDSKPTRSKSRDAADRQSDFAANNTDRSENDAGCRRCSSPGLEDHESTARSGVFRDYQVAFPSDCNASFDDGMHQASLKTIDMFFGRVMTSEELLYEMRNELGRNGRVAAE
jgi:hypothetical protein